MNYPARAATVLQTNVWYHAAVTFDGRYWRFYLNGVQDGATVDTGASRLPCWDSIQHAGIGTAMTSAPSPSGYFAGVLDEVRIWNVVRSQSEIQAGMNSELTAGTGLIGRWGMIEGSGTTTADSTTPAETGTLTNGALWACGKFAVNCGLGFDGSNDYVTMGAAPGLNASTFTLETWFNWTWRRRHRIDRQRGLATAYPLITKGRGEGDGSNVDMNYFFGIQDGKLAADFEDSATGLNHPVIGSSTVAHRCLAARCSHLRRHHLAAVSERQPGHDPGRRGIRTSLRQHPALRTGNCHDLHGVTDGFFQGAIDEARIWNLARSEAEIAANINSQLTSGTGLIGRWGMNENSTLVIDDFVAPIRRERHADQRSLLGRRRALPTSPSARPPPQQPVCSAGRPGSQIDLAWTDNSNNESGFAVEYALGPACDTWSCAGQQRCQRQPPSATGTPLSIPSTATACAPSKAADDFRLVQHCQRQHTPESYSALSLGRDNAYVRFPSNVLHLKTVHHRDLVPPEGPGHPIPPAPAASCRPSRWLPRALPRRKAPRQDENFLLGHR